MDLRINLDKMIEQLYTSNYEKREDLVHLANILGINSHYTVSMTPLYIAFNIRSHLVWVPTVYSNKVLSEACQIINKIINDIHKTSPSKTYF